MIRVHDKLTLLVIAAAGDPNIAVQARKGGRYSVWMHAVCAANGLPGWMIDQSTLYYGPRGGRGSRGGRCYVCRCRLDGPPPAVIPVRD